MKEMQFRTVGALPVAKGQWFIREGGGHLWFVNEDPAVAPMALVDGQMRVIVDAAENPDAPLVQQRELA